MAGILCTKEFREFYQSINRNGIHFHEYALELKKQMKTIAPELHIGKGTVHYEAPCTLHEPDGTTRDESFYEAAEGYDTGSVFLQKFTVDGKGVAEFAVYPLKGYIWSDDEKQEISFLLSVIFYAGSRIRIAELLQKTTMMDATTGAVNAEGLHILGDELFDKNLLKNYIGIYANIKNFRYINQRMGSKLGDMVLRKYTQYVLAGLKEGEIIARMGADNFLILLRKENENQDLSYFEKCRVAVPMHGVTQQLDVIVRMGVCAIEEKEDVSEVIHKASVAYSMAKNPSSQSIVWFQESMLEKNVHDKEISNRFSQAIRDREFVVYYQPKVTLENKHLCSGEALTRWVQNGKIVPPMDFIPVLEREGSICELDFYVLDTVCHNLRDWLDRGIEPVPVSVNFSKVHLHNRDLAERILEVMHKYNIDSKYIEIELTEMSEYEDFAALNEFVSVMKQAGVNTSIDDFGTGYSSLNLLKDLNVDIIKLDKSFLKNLEKEGTNDKKVIRSIVNMVNELDMQVVAEGVETLEQMEFLKTVNCSMAQGFLFDRPLPREEFEWRLLGERMY